MITKTINNYTIRTDLLYHPEHHYWIDINDDITTIGLTPLIQETSGAFVAVQYESNDSSYKKDERFGSMEAEKHVGQLFMPLSGDIIAQNPLVLKNPRLINTDPYGDGWLIKIKTSDLSSEMKYLLQSEQEISTWFEAEIEKYDKKGWIAQS